jgi:hypothetical protein
MMLVVILSTVYLLDKRQIFLDVRSKEKMEKPEGID